MGFSRGRIPRVPLGPERLVVVDATRYRIPSEHRVRATSIWIGLEVVTATSPSTLASGDQHSCAFKDQTLVLRPELGC